jgi:predicted permease
MHSSVLYIFCLALANVVRAEDDSMSLWWYIVPIGVFTLVGIYICATFVYVIFSKLKKRQHYSVLTPGRVGSYVNLGILDVENN